uniref:PIN domain-containing protein n=1 Tax=mine drainage metagenome TaxID=410659 RepID=E6QKC3_9ZZZZ
MTFLLDVNVVIALIDPVHNFHDAAHEWLSSIGHAAWATCPVTENGVLRIVGHPRYRNSPRNLGAIFQAVSDLCALPGHVFWPDDISILDEKWINAGNLLTSSQVTDSYLLALAIRNGGRLATFDRRLVPDAVNGGKAGLHLIGSDRF